MTKLEQAARKALEALEMYRPLSLPIKLLAQDKTREEAITALREALAEQAEQPVNDNVEEYLCSRCCQPTMYPGGKCYKCSNESAQQRFCEYPRCNCEKDKQCKPEKQPVSELVAWAYEYGTDRGDAVNEVRWYSNVSLTKPTGFVRNIRPLYAAPTQPVKQEPVAVGRVNDQACIDWFEGISDYEAPVGAILYTAPVQQVDLTEEEIYTLYSEPCSDREMIEFARAVIAADREKNK